VVAFVLRAVRKTRPKTQPQTRRRASEGLKPAILDAARRLCFTEGVEGISARKIAQRVGCSATAIYLHYRNLDDVLHHLRMEGHALLARYFGEVDAALPPAARLVEMGRAYHRFGTEHPNYYELMFLYRYKDVPRRELVQQEMLTLLQVRDAVQAGIDAGTVRDDLDAFTIAHGLWSTLHGLTALAVTGLLIRTAPGKDHDLLAAVLDGIARWIAPLPAARTRSIRRRG
jgi:AcrR family transcriptional regulator